MKVINFGSLNIDLVYHVREFARPGETITATNFARFAGGKGLNQSVALSRAGAPVVHAGMVGSDGAKSPWLPRLFPRRWRGLLRYRLLLLEEDSLGLPDKGDAVGATSTLGIPSDLNRSGLQG